MRGAALRKSRWGHALFLFRTCNGALLVGATDPDDVDGWRAYRDASCREPQGLVQRRPVDAGTGTASEWWGRAPDTPRARHR